jgi:hypothetical protein
MIPFDLMHCPAKARSLQRQQELSSSQEAPLLKRNLMVVVTWAPYLSCTRDDDWHSDP